MKMVVTTLENQKVISLPEETTQHVKSEVILEDSKNLLSDVFFCTIR